MHGLHTFLLIFTFLFSSHLCAKGISQKLIVSSHKNLKVTQEDLLALKVYFIENPDTHRLREKYMLQIDIENFSEYKAVVVSPINNIEVRNELMVLLKPLFPDIFYVERIVKTEKIHQSSEKTAVTSTVPSVKMKQDKSLFDEIGFQWLAIWILAVIGLILSIRNRRKIAQLKQTQEKIKIDQKNIETEINYLGEQNA